MKNFSFEEQEMLRAFIFTNPHGETSLVYPQPLIAGEELSPLMSAYSRTHVPMQDRVLQFLDQQKADQVKSYLPLLQKEFGIFRNADGSLKISKRTTNFNKEWVLKHGHDSIKEETQLFGHVENISDITGKKITGHPLNHPQVKSTRYISFGSVTSGALADVDLLGLEGSDRFIEQIDNLNKGYMRAKVQLAEKVWADASSQDVAMYLRDPLQVKEAVWRKVLAARNKDAAFSLTPEVEEKFREEYLHAVSPENLRKNIDKFVLDYVRVYLPAATKTSLGFSADARTLENILTGMISSPRKEDQQRGYELWGEAKKIAPVLLGEKSHIGVSDWKVYEENVLRPLFEDMFKDVPVKNNGTPAVNLIHPQKVDMFSDRFEAALLVFPFVDASLSDIYDHLSSKDLVKFVIDKVHEGRGEYDILHPALGHGGLMPEFVMGYHGYRDMFRHRNGNRSVQLLTTRLGFEVPEIFKTFGMAQQYLDDMAVASEVYELARAHDPHVAEKLVPFGANCRSLHSWQPSQVGYVGKLRSDIAKGNVSYVLVARELMDEVGKLMPETAKHFRGDDRVYPLDLWKKGYDWYDAAQEEK